MMKERESKEEKLLHLVCWGVGCGAVNGATPCRRMDQRDEMVAPEDDDTADARLMAEVRVAAQSATPFRDTRCTS
jgi:hypothetical protein